MRLPISSPFFFLWISGRSSYSKRSISKSDVLTLTGRRVQNWRGEKNISEKKGRTRSTLSDLSHFLLLFTANDILTFFGIHSVLSLPPSRLSLSSFLLYSFHHLMSHRVLFLKRTTRTSFPLLFLFYFFLIIPFNIWRLQRARATRNAYFCFSAIRHAT